jgi:hypothetical protein
MQVTAFHVCLGAGSTREVYFPNFSSLYAVTEPLVISMLARFSPAKAASRPFVATDGEETASNYLILRRCPPVPPSPDTHSFRRKPMTENPTNRGVSATPSFGSRARKIDGQAHEDFRNPGINQLVTTAVAADLLGLTVRGLEGMRMRRIGPPFVRISRRCIRYNLADLERFILTKMVRTEAYADIPTC